MVMKRTDILGFRDTSFFKVKKVRCFGVAPDDSSHPLEALSTQPSLSSAHQSCVMRLRPGGSGSWPGQGQSNWVSFGPTGGAQIETEPRATGVVLDGVGPVDLLEGGPLAPAGGKLIDANSLSCFRSWTKDPWTFFEEALIRLEISGRRSSRMFVSHNL